MSSSPQTGPGPAPAMAYTRLASPDSAHGHDDDDQRLSFSVRLHSLLRPVLFALALASVIVWSTRRPFNRGDSAMTALVVFLFLVLFWNFGLSSLHLKRPVAIRALPACVCQVGKWGCVLNGDNEEQIRVRRTENDPRQRRLTRLLIALVDAVLGQVVLVLAVTGWKKAPWQYRWNNMEPVMKLNMAIGALELIVVLLSLVPWLRNIVFDIGVAWRDIDDVRPRPSIRLPDDSEDRRTAGGTVSLAA